MIRELSWFIYDYFTYCLLHSWGEQNIWWLNHHNFPCVFSPKVAAAETFMLRLAVVLMVAGLGASGYAIVFPPPLGQATVPSKGSPLGIHGDYETSVFFWGVPWRYAPWNMDEHGNMGGSKVNLGSKNEELRHLKMFSLGNPWEPSEVKADGCGMVLLLGCY